MNTALQSGYDLGWKLAWVLQGWAEPALLDTYESRAARRGGAQRRRAPPIRTGAGGRSSTS